MLVKINHSGHREARSSLRRDRREKQIDTFTVEAP
jgi:hypothetical protein